MAIFDGISLRQFIVLCRNKNETSERFASKLPKWLTYETKISHVVTSGKEVRIVQFNVHFQVRTRVRTRKQIEQKREKL